MEDISEKISALLESPDAMDRLKSVAEGLLSNNSTRTEQPQKEDKEKEQGFSLPDNLLQNIGNMQGIMRLANFLGKEQKDSRIDLLRALKPHLSEERAKRVDKAISILKIATILPILREEGLLDSLGF